MKRLILAVTAIIFVFTATAGASDLVFEFTNPSFGGNAFNGQWILAKAQAQSRFKEKIEPFKLPERDPLEEFTDRLRYAVLNGISNKITEQIFGGESVTGHYNVGDYQIDIADSIDNIELVITDPTNGNTTEIVIPKL